MGLPPIDPWEPFYGHPDAPELGDVFEHANRRWRAADLRVHLRELHGADDIRQVPFDLRMVHRGAHLRDVFPRWR